MKRMYEVISETTGEQINRIDGAEYSVMLAAPSMLDALKTVLGCVNLSDNPSAEKIIRAAIKQADS